MSVLAYVDETLARQLATGLIGSEVRLTDAEASRLGVNFRVILTQERKQERSTSTKTSDLLPEVLADAIYTATANRIDSLEAARRRLVAGGENSFRPGAAIVVSNCQFGSEGKAKAALSNEECIVYRLRVGEFFMQSYVPLSSEAMLDSLVGQPTEVSGILRYTPSYSVPGALSLNLGLRVCAIWLR